MLQKVFPSSSWRKGNLCNAEKSKSESHLWTLEACKWRRLSYAHTFDSHCAAEGVDW